MNPRRVHLYIIGCLVGACLGLAMPAVAQYNRVPVNTNPGYNQSNLQQNLSNFQGNTQNSSNNPDQLNLRRNRSLRSRSNSSTSDDSSVANPASQRGSLSGRNQLNSSRAGGASNLQSPGIQPANAMNPPANTSPINPNLSLPVSPQGGQPGQAVSPRGPSSNYTRNVIHRTVTEEPIRQNATLYLNPSSSYAILNQPITVDVVLSNKKKVKFDRLAFLIQYDPQDLLLTTGQKNEEKWQNAASLPIPSAIHSVSSAENEKKSGFLAADTAFQITQNIVDSNRGLILFDAKVSQVPLATEGKVIPLTFIPLREITTKVSFLFVDPDQKDASQGPFTRLSLDDLDQLGTRFSQADGVSNLDLPIFATFEQAQRQPVISKAGEPSGNIDEEGSDILLSLVPRKEMVNVGDIVNVDIVLQNQDKKAFDTIYLLIAYNPRFFEPVDGDDYSNGINIADKEYGENFGLDFPILNIVDKQKGIIDYRKKAMKRPVRSQGILATIQLQAIRPTKKSTFRLFLNDTGQEPTTGIFYRYKDRLGDDSDPFDGVTTCSIGIRATTAYLKKLSEEGE